MPQSARYVCLPMVHVCRMAKLSLGKEDEALPWLHRSVETNRNIRSRIFFWLRFWRVLGGSPKRGPRPGQDWRSARLSPSRRHASTPSDDPTVAAGEERFIDGLRKAGVPEQ